jgi:hypothetical protein
MKGDVHRHSDGHADETTGLVGGAFPKDEATVTPPTKALQSFYPAKKPVEQQFAVHTNSRGKCYYQPTPYPGDHLPADIPRADADRYRQRYKCIPEEYYSATKLPVVTPDNFEEWFAATPAEVWDFWEWCSGSGRTSLQAKRQGLREGFPVDARYGWDLHNAAHRAKLARARKKHQPGVILISPDCRVWGNAGNRADPEQREEDRMATRPFLLWLHEQCALQDQKGAGYLTENPVGSVIFTESPLMHNKHNANFQKLQRTDQCRHGCVDETGKAIKKPTFWDANFKLRKTAVRCHAEFHNSQPHGELRGRAPGTAGNRTALAAVYPLALCKAILADVVSFLKGKDV